MEGSWIIFGLQVESCVIIMPCATQKICMSDNIPGGSDKNSSLLI